MASLSIGSTITRVVLPTLSFAINLPATVSERLPNHTHVTKKCQLIINQLLTTDRETYYKKYRFMERWLILLALMHSEKLMDVQICLQEYQHLADETYE